MSNDTSSISDEALDDILNSTQTDDSEEGYHEIGSESGSSDNADVNPSDDIDVEQPEDEETETAVGQTDESPDDSEDSLSTEEDEDGDDLDETDEDNESSDSDSEDDSEVDSDTEDEPYVFQPLRADGKEYPIENIQELYTLASKGINADRKWQESAEGRRIQSTLKKNKLTQQDINLLVDLKSGNKDAILSLLKNAEIDPLDIDTDALDGDYRPKEHGTNDFEMKLDDVVSKIKTKPRYDESVSVIMDDWDEQSKQTFYDNPQILELLNIDMQTNPQTGFSMYDKVAPLAVKMKSLEQGVVKSDLEYYQMAGARVIDAMERSNQSKADADTNSKNKQSAKKKSIAKKKKAAASSGGKSTGKKAVDVTSLSDDELDALLEETG